MRASHVCAVFVLVLLAAPLGALAQGVNVSCVILTRNFSPGDSDATTGGEVSQLQQFLARDASLYPEGLVTGFYGVATMRAVQRYQSRSGIISTGGPANTGYGAIGPRTREHIARNCSVSTGTGTQNGSALFLSLASYPQQPLTPGALGTWTLLSTGGTQPHTYAAEWGDGQVSSIQSSPTFRHAFSAPGVFSPVFAVRDALGQTRKVNAPVITISALSTLNCSLTASPASITAGQSATITWSSPGATSGTITGIGSVEGESGAHIVSPSQTTTYTGTFNAGGGSSVTCAVTIAVGAVGSANQATSSPGLSVSPTSGNVPLVVAATIVNGSSCSPYTLTWGDGTNDNYGGPSQGTNCTQVLTTGSKSHTYSAAGNYTVTFQQGGFTQSQVVTALAAATNAPTCALTASPATINAGENSTISWNSTGATAISISTIGTVSGAVGSQTVTPGQTITYTGVFSGPGGLKTCEATVTVQGSGGSGGKGTGMLCGSRVVQCGVNVRKSGVLYGDETYMRSSLPSGSAFGDPDAIKKEVVGIFSIWTTPRLGTANIPCEGVEITVKACTASAGQEDARPLGRDIVCPAGYGGHVLAGATSGYLLSCVKGVFPAKLSDDNCDDFGPARKAGGCREKR